MFPKFDPRSICYFLVNRERYVEPLHKLNGTDEIPPIKTPVENLYLATTAQIYPALTNGESVTRNASHTAEMILKDLLVLSRYQTPLPEQYVAAGKVYL